MTISFSNKAKKLVAGKFISMALATTSITCSALYSAGAVAVGQQNNQEIEPLTPAGYMEAMDVIARDVTRNMTGELMTDPYKLNKQLTGAHIISAIDNLIDLGGCDSMVCTQQVILGKWTGADGAVKSPDQRQILSSVNNLGRNLKLFEETEDKRFFFAPINTVSVTQDADGKKNRKGHLMLGVFTKKPEGDKKMSWRIYDSLKGGTGQDASLVSNREGYRLLESAVQPFVEEAKSSDVVLRMGVQSSNSTTDCGLHAIGAAKGVMSSAPGKLSDQDAAALEGSESTIDDRAVEFLNRLQNRAIIRILNNTAGHSIAWEANEIDFVVKIADQIDYTKAQAEEALEILEESAELYGLDSHSSQKIDKYLELLAGSKQGEDLSKVETAMKKIAVAMTSDHISNKRSSLYLELMMNILREQGIFSPEPEKNDELMKKFLGRVNEVPPLLPEGSAPSARDDSLTSQAIFKKAVHLAEAKYVNFAKSIEDEKTLLSFDKILNEYLGQPFTADRTVATANTGDVVEAKEQYTEDESEAGDQGSTKNSPETYGNGITETATLIPGSNDQSGADEAGENTQALSWQDVEVDPSHRLLAGLGLDKSGTTKTPKPKPSIDALDLVGGDNAHVGSNHDMGAIKAKHNAWQERVSATDGSLSAFIKSRKNNNPNRVWDGQDQILEDVFKARLEFLNCWGVNDHLRGRTPEAMIEALKAEFKSLVEVKPETNAKDRDFVLSALPFMKDDNSLHHLRRAFNLAIFSPDIPKDGIYKVSWKKKARAAEKFFKDGFAGRNGVVVDINSVRQKLQPVIKSYLAYLTHAEKMGSANPIDSAIKVKILMQEVESIIRGVNIVNNQQHALQALPFMQDPDFLAELRFALNPPNPAKRVALPANQINAVAEWQRKVRAERAFFEDGFAGRNGVIINQDEIKRRVENMLNARFEHLSKMGNDIRALTQSLKVHFLTQEIERLIKGQKLADEDSLKFIHKTLPFMQDPDFLVKLRAALNPSLPPAPSGDADPTPEFPVVLTAEFTLAMVAEREAQKEAKKVEAKQVSRKYDAFGGLDFATNNVAGALDDNDMNMMIAVAAGNDPVWGKSIWARGSYGSSVQKPTTGHVGNRGNVVGGSIGFEIASDEGATYGLAYTRAQGKYKFKDGDSARIDFNTFSLYGERHFDKIMLRGIVSYGRNSFNTKDGVESPEEIITGSFKGSSYGVDLMAGYKIEKGGFNFMPFAEARYGYASQGQYKDSKGRTIEKRSSHAWTGIAGLRLVKAIKHSSGAVFAPFLTGSAQYDFSSAKQKTRAFDASGNLIDLSVIDDGKEFERPRFGYNVGSGVMVRHNAIELSAQYTGHFRKHFHSHQGSLKLKVAL